MKKDFKKLRHEYIEGTLNESDMHSNPFIQFQTWFKQAVNLELPDANAMTLATVSSDNRASARILLLKEYNEKGFCFFTNYNSRKGIDIKGNPSGALVFFWPELERQVRIEGKIEKLEAHLSDEYFFERPIGSRTAASISPQSNEIESREVLTQMVEKFVAENGTQFSRPDFWGGYRLIPDLFEFWQGRENRLNDRIEYNFKNKIWTSRRLAP
ncbi:pyridoxamine 5'-phosphate oxidase [Labilibaculum filiforme]|uniref:Pyridoxine/pyridoxamine 5'-phosphate oxidase n=1 Tax=Labilibaculum filiforme TaxID=1940526 RepID=A0A2N3HW14_9BACT|nr:pyridoxamine 5'-phosphate oxidase [Labilibaculum filiforme]PKQ62223.1 pyridoxamine 5'-phosphate oxidase [Labilibaculum filiforme]